MSSPTFRVKSLKRPYRTDKIGHTHDRWVVDYREGDQWKTLLDADYSKSEAKEEIREHASPGDRISIQDMDGNHLRVEVISE